MIQERAAEDRSAGEEAPTFAALRSKLQAQRQKKNTQRPAAAMSLYYEAAAILANPEKVGGSLVSRIFKKKDLKSSPGQVFALIAEASKWSLVLKDVIEKCRLLAEERKVRDPLA